MGIVQDTLLGSQKMTKRDVFIEKAMLMNMCMWMKHWTGVIPQPAVMIPTKGRPGTALLVSCVHWQSSTPHTHCGGAALARAVSQASTAPSGRESR
jgi:DNA-directed RNA polymerase II subunit RPB1